MSHTSIVILRTCQTVQILPIVANTSAVLLSKWSVSCELSALTVRGLATLDFFPGGVRWVWSWRWSSCSGTHSLCSRTGGWLWEAPTRPGMGHLLWLTDQARCINDWYEEAQNIEGKWKSSKLHSCSRGSTWMEAERGNSDDTGSFPSVL